MRVAMAILTYSMIRIHGLIPEAMGAQYQHLRFWRKGHVKAVRANKIQTAAHIADYRSNASRRRLSVRRRSRFVGCSHLACSDEIQGTEYGSRDWKLLRQIDCHSRIGSKVYASKGEG